MAEKRVESTDTSEPRYQLRSRLVANSQFLAVRYRCRPRLMDELRLTKVIPPKVDRIQVDSSPREMPQLSPTLEVEDESKEFGSSFSRPVFSVNPQKRVCRSRTKSNRCLP